MSARRLLAAGVGLSALLAPAAGTAQAFDDGLEAFRRGDYPLAAETWERCARQGVAPCQYGLGVIFDEGRGVPPDSRRALLWLLQAARQGFTDAQIQIGFIYATGREQVAQDPVQAYVWFALAATSGDPRAVQHRDRVAELLTPAEMDEGERRKNDLSIEYHLQE